MAGRESILEVARYRDQDMPRFLQTLFSDDSSDLSLTSHDLNSLGDLANKFSRVRQDNHLNLHDTWVYPHKTGHYKSASLTAAIHRLERIVVLLVVHDMRDGLGLNN